MVKVGAMIDLAQQNSTSKTFSEFSNTYLFLDGEFVCDDAMTRPKLKEELSKVSIDEFLFDELENQTYDNLYFPNINASYVEDYDFTKWISTPLLNSTLIGSSNSSYIKDGVNWYCTFNDLNKDGKDFYFSMKKLFNNKEVRILTFQEKEILS